MGKYIVNIVLLALYSAISFSQFLVMEYQKQDVTNFQMLFTIPSFYYVKLFLIMKTIILFIVIPFVIKKIYNQVFSEHFTTKEIDYSQAMTLYLMVQIIIIPFM